MAKNHGLLKNPKPVPAWWFGRRKTYLGYGDKQRIREGKKLGPEKAMGWGATGITSPFRCHRGYHASVNLIDAADYEKGWWLWRVELSGMMDVGPGKIAAMYRRHIKAVNFKPIFKAALKRFGIERKYRYGFTRPAFKYMRFNTFKSDRQHKEFWKWCEQQTLIEMGLLNPMDGHND